MEHKHAAVLRAIADKGFEAGEWQHSFGDWREAHDFLNPLTHPQLEWRIKPEPKPDRIEIRGLTYDSCDNNFDFIGANSISHLKIGMLSLTIDGETHMLKSAEVLT